MMSLFEITGILVFGIGIFGFMVHTHLMRKIIAFNITSAGIFLFLVASGHKEGGLDPVPQALVLTGLVISVSATAFALFLARRIYQAELEES